jgi:hypothetical protein
MSVLAHPSSQAASQAASQHPDVLGVHEYWHSGHVYFFFLMTRIQRVFAPLLTQLLQPLPSQESHDPHAFFRCHGKTTRGMQIVFVSTSKHDFSTSTILASSEQSQLGHFLQGQQMLISAFTFLACVA